MNVINVSVEPQKYETVYSLVNRFIRKVDADGILKDYKLSKMTKRDRETFKKFSSDRRKQKQLKRVQAATLSE